jgi:hypothetical protein
MIRWISSFSVPESARTLDGFASGYIQGRRTETWSRCECNRDFGVRVRPAATAGSAVSDPVSESGFSHPRTAPARAAEGLDTGLQCPVPFLRRTDLRNSLKASTRCGCSENVRQMRETADWDRPLACAMVRVDQCVPCAGTVSKVRVIKASTSASVICRGAPGRGSSARPSNRALRKRSRHLHTVWSVIPSCLLAIVSVLADTGACASVRSTLA